MLPHISSSLRQLGLNKWTQALIALDYHFSYQQLSHTFFLLFSPLSISLSQSLSLSQSIFISSLFCLPVHHAFRVVSIVSQNYLSSGPRNITIKTSLELCNLYILSAAILNSHTNRHVWEPFSKFIN